MSGRRIPWVALACAAAPLLGLLGTRMHALGLLRLPPCPLKAISGLSCAACGLTRWALALGRGDWAGALHWHPVATLALGLLPWAAAWDLRRAWRNRPYPGLPESAWARGAAATLLAAAWAIQAARGI